MSGFSFENLPAIIREVNTCVAQCIIDIDEARSEFATMRQDLEQSIEDARESVTQKAAGLSETQSRQLQRAVDACTEYATYIKNLSEDAKNRSKSYRKSFIESTCSELAQPRYSIESLTQCQERLSALANEAASAHALIVTSGGVGGIISSISGNDKKNHADLIRAYQSSKDLLFRAKALAAEATFSGTTYVEDEAQRAIDRAEEEGRSLREQIDRAEEERLSRCFSSLELRLENMIGSNRISALSELDILTKPSWGAEPHGLCREFRLGDYICSLDGWPYRGVYSPIETALERHFGSWYNSGLLRVPALKDRACSSSIVLCGSIEETAPALNWLILSEAEMNQAPEQTFIFANPRGDRQTFEPFLAAIQTCSEVFGSEVVTNSEAVVAMLKKAVDTINDRTQRLLVGYESIFEFNENDETTDLPLITLCIAAPLDVLPLSAQESIKSIARNGSYCGINILLALDVDDADVEKSTEFLTGCGNDVLIGWPAAHDTRIEIGDGTRIEYEAIDAARVAADSVRMRSQIQAALSRTIDITSVLPRTDWYTGSSLKGLSLPMGKKYEGTPALLEFGPEVSNGISHFGLMTGATGSGKSALLHSLIMAALLKYGPDELQLYLLDFKSGVEFEIYSKFRIPHLKLLALDAMQAFGLSVLQELRQQMDKRNTLFKNAGVQNIEEYRNTTGNSMPRILVLMDEFQSLFNEDHDKKTARKSAILLADFISLARNCGIHFLLSTQTFGRLRTGNFSIPQSTLDEMHVRIGLQCSPDETRKLFGDIYGNQAYELMGERKGCGVYTENDLKLPPEAFRSVFCGRDEREALLEEIQSRYATINICEETRVFRGDSIPEIQEGITGAARAENSGNVAIYLGEPLKIDQPIAVNMNRRMRSTLLMVGSDGPMLDMLMGNYLYSVLKAEDDRNHDSDCAPTYMTPTVYLCDGASMMGERKEDSVVMRVCSSRHEEVRIAEENRDILRFVDELYRLMIKRQTDPSADQHAVFLLINEFQWITAFNAIYERRDTQFDQPMNERTGVDADPSVLLDNILEGLTHTAAGAAAIGRLEKIERLLQQGYAYGINIAIGSTDYTALKERIFDLVPSMQNRVVFSLNGEDAERLIHDSMGLVGTLKPNMAVFSNGRDEPEIFKPYRIATLP